MVAGPVDPTTDDAIHIAETYGNKSTYGKPSNMGEYCECDSSNVCDLGKAAYVKSRLDFGGGENPSKPL